MSATASTEQQLGIQLPVKGFRAQGAGDAFVGLAAAATQYFLAGFFLALAVNPSIYSAEPTARGRVIAVALAIAVYAFGRWGRRQIRRAATLDARLVVMPDCVIVRHGGLLTGPVMIPRECVESVAVDDGRSPFAGKAHRPRLPMLDVLPRTPNVMLLFNQLVDFPARPRWLPPSRPLPGRAELGLLVRVKDSAAAQRAFAGWPA